ncbi:nucleotide exchange factor GrpE [Pseudoxanthomonas taiwanensis]|jgi:Molecular chaperone GrpE (heat shock protein)|uniref:Protein GrpE n=1 Tax=Pseudoxanthomonas taiwanensis TaxID=176598 RepID=A0A921NTN8_9GAMM|nr:nucleotide exchange factor GrpE [Pseudoxanthomonas taiwanensis]KAF1689541.1 nucleotide exchange factor GrpE [Pseudoxanthomonas taiwanensis]MBO2466887.1 nucleotide exchange factor GrpE [Xanthomonadaceae bacterium]
MTQNETPSQQPEHPEQPQTTGEAAAATTGADPLESQLRAEIEALRSEIEQLRMDALRERADLDNQRKRMARELEQARRFANERLLGDLLPVLDSLDAGLAAAGAEGGPLKEGLELTYRQLMKVAGDHGLSVVDPVGQPFDPERHQAISQADPGEAAPGSVLQVFQKGYMLHDRLLRPALVVVARHD